MNEVQKIALDRAVKMLTAAGVQFAVLMPDGSKIGALEIAPPKPEKGPRVRVYNLRQYGYIEAVEKMAEGESRVFPFPAELDAKGRDAYAGAISACGCNRFGKGNFITARTAGGDALEALRVA